MGLYDVFVRCMMMIVIPHKKESICNPPHKESFCSPLQKESFCSPLQKESFCSPPQKESICNLLEGDSALRPEQGREKEEQNKKYKFFLQKKKHSERNNKYSDL